MANILMWHQGRREFNPLDCGGGPQFSCPESKRVAAEYNRGHYTLTNVLNPNWDNNYYGRENWQQSLVDEVKVGDVVWFLLAPPKHNVYDVAAFAEETLTDGSTLSSLAGLRADLVTAKFAEKNANGLCEPTALTNQGAVNFPSGTNPGEIFVQKKVEIVNGPKEWLGVGLRINAMPTGKTDLSTIRAKIAVVAHVLGYDAQTHM